ncbi:MAG: Ig domain-containing protein [Candidatus Coproplasma sp.]
MKVTKRLFNSIVCLTVSLAVCVWAVYAWFAQNDKVSSDGANTSVNTPDLEDFNVTAYYLDYNGTNTDEYKKAASGNISGSFDKTVDSDELGTLDKFETSSDQMRPYDSLRPYATAVLFEIKYKIKSGSDKDFRIYANCPYEIGDMTENVFTIVKDTDASDAFFSSVSNCVFMNAATVTGDVYTYDSENNQRFIKSDGTDTKYFTKYLDDSEEGSVVRDGQEHTLNVIVDYDAELFTKLSTYMLSAGGTLNSSLTFLGDLTFGIEDYDSSETRTVESIQLVESTSTTVYVKETEVTPDWKFLLTYSDGTLETVKYNSANFTIVGDIDTSSTTSPAEPNSVTVSYNGVEASCSVEYTVVNAAVTGITLSSSSLSLEEGNTATLTAKVVPDNATNKAVTWSSSDSSVATVDENGVVTAVNAGSAIITATSEENSDIKATCSVTVKAAPVAVTGVAISGATEVDVGSTIALTATVSPENATDKTVTWSVADGTGSATINTSTGVLTGVSAGTVTVTVTSNSDSNKSETYTVTVNSVAVTGVSLDKTSLSLTVGNTGELTATIAPANATNKAVTWTSSNESVATVSNGVVTALKAGVTTITVTTSGGNYTASCSVTVTEASAITVWEFNCNNPPESYTKNTALTYGSVNDQPVITIIADEWSTSNDSGSDSSWSLGAFKISGGTNNISNRLFKIDLSSTGANISEDTKVTITITYSQKSGSTGWLSTKYSSTLPGNTDADLIKLGDVSTGYGIMTLSAEVGGGAIYYFCHNTSNLYVKGIKVEYTA